MKRTRLFSNLVTAVLVLTIGGCFDAHIELKVSKDGSGTLTETTYFSKQVSAMMAMAASGEGQEGAKNPLEQMIDKDVLAKKANTLGEGITLQSAKALKEEDGRQGAQIVYAIADVNKFKLPLSTDLSTGAPGGTGGPEAAAEGKKEQKETAVINFTKATADTPATLTINMPKRQTEEKAEATGKEEGQPTPAKSPQPGAEKADEEAAKAIMKQMMGDMRMRITVKVDGKITKTNATFVNDDKTGITLIDMNFGKLLTDDKLMAKMQGIEQPKTLEEAKKIFNDPAFKDFMKFELEEKVTVEFK